MRPKTLQSRLNCLNYAENRRFISFFVQKKKAYKLIFVRKKPNSINIYKWDKTAAKNRDFLRFWLKNLTDRWKMGGKVGSSIWKEISSGFQKWHQIFDSLIRSLNILWNVTYGDFLKKARIQLDFLNFWDFWDFELQLLEWKHV